MNNTMNKTQVRQALADITDSVSFKSFDKETCQDNVFTAKKSYFWGLTSDGSGLADKVKKALPEAFVLDYGNHFHHFLGSARPGSGKDSYFWVKFKVALN